MHHLTTRVRNRPPPPPPPLPTANRLHSDKGDRERAAHSIPFRRRRRRRPPTTDPGPQPRHHSASWLLFAKSRAHKTALAATGKAPRRQKAFSPRPWPYLRVSRNGAAREDQGPLAIGAYMRPRANGREPSPPGLGREGGRSDQTRRPGWRPGRAERPDLFTTKQPNASLGTWHVPRGWGFKVCLGLTGRQSRGGGGWVRTQSDTTKLYLGIAVLIRMT